MAEQQKNIDIIDVSCPHCGQTYELEANSIGSEAECGACGTVFVVSAPQENKVIKDTSKKTSAPQKTAKDSSLKMPTPKKKVSRPMPDAMVKKTAGKPNAVDAVPDVTVKMSADELNAVGAMPDATLKITPTQ